MVVLIVKMAVLHLHVPFDQQRVSHYPSSV